MPLNDEDDKAVQAMQVEIYADFIHAGQVDVKQEPESPHYMPTSSMHYLPSSPLSTDSSVEVAKANEKDNSNCSPIVFIHL